MNSSGMTALATSGAGAITLLPADAKCESAFVLVVGGTAAGSISFDGGLTWGYVPGAVDSTHPTTVCLPGLKLGGMAVLFQRATVTDVTGIYAWSV